MKIRAAATFMAMGITLCCTSACQTAPLPMPTPQNEVRTIFYDAFIPEKGELRNLWQTNGKGAWLVQRKISSLSGCEDGCLKQNSEDPRALNTIYYVRTPQMADGVIETKARLTYELSVSETHERLNQIKSFIGAGIIFRMTDENNFYMFRLAGEEGVVLGKMVNGDWIDLGNPRRVDFLEGGRVKPNTWYTLKVAARGGQIQCFINNNPVISINDATFSLGKFGLTTFKTMADFEYISVTE